MAAALLACFPLALRALRGMPSHEYAQAVRAPAWLVVVIGGGIALASALALGQLSAQNDQVLVGWPGESPLLMVDGYSLWCSLLLGLALAVAAWVPAARRSLVPRTVWPCLLILVQSGFALLVLFGVRLPLLFTHWFIMLIAGVLAWIWLFRPARQWREWELPLVLALAGVLSGIGLAWLNAQAHGESLQTAWSPLLAGNPHATHGAMLLVLLGWLGPLVYLPWWSWDRRREEAALWQPAMVLLAMTGMLALVRLIFLAFPAGSIEFSRDTSLHGQFLIKRIFTWLTAWGLLALLAGAGLLVASVVSRREELRRLGLRPLVLVLAGVLLVCLAAGLQAPRGTGIGGLLWAQLGWVGSLGILLASAGMLDALTPAERTERGVVLAALTVGLASLAALPPFPGFRGLAALWNPLQRAGTSHVLLVLTLVVSVLCAGWLSRRWTREHAASEHRPGAAWGILAPFSLALLLLFLGLLAPIFAPLVQLVRASLMQSF